MQCSILTVTISTTTTARVISLRDYWLQYLGNGRNPNPFQYFFRHVFNKHHVGRRRAFNSNKLWFAWFREWVHKFKVRQCGRVRWSNMMIVVHDNLLVNHLLWPLHRLDHLDYWWTMDIFNEYVLPLRSQLIDHHSNGLWLALNLFTNHLWMRIRLRIGHDHLNLDLRTTRMRSTFQRRQYAHQVNITIALTRTEGG